MPPSLLCHCVTFSSSFPDFITNSCSYSSVHQGGQGPVPALALGLVLHICTHTINSAFCQLLRTESKDSFSHKDSPPPFIFFFLSMYGEKLQVSLVIYAGSVSSQQLSRVLRKSYSVFWLSSTVIYNLQMSAHTQKLVDVSNPKHQNYRNHGTKLQTPS